MTGKEWDLVSEMAEFREKMDRIMDDLFPERARARALLAPDGPPRADIRKREPERPQAGID